jgi:hypothetical protein
MTNQNPQSKIRNRAEGELGAANPKSMPERNYLSKSIFLKSASFMASFL